MRRSSNSPADSLIFFIKDSADLAVALSGLGQSTLLSEVTDQHRSVIKTITSELGTNIIKYAQRGVLTVTRVESSAATYIEILAEDQGPGIPDVELAMLERFTTGSSLGLGLPGVKRMADIFSIKSAVGKGTSIIVKKSIRGNSTSEKDPENKVASDSYRAPLKADSLRSAVFDLSYYIRPSQGEVKAGDTAIVVELTGGVLVALVDVSGHGFKASALALEIRELISHYATPRITELMTLLHERLRGTLGAAVSLLFMDTLRCSLNYCAVGNTAAYRVIGQTWRPISKDGVVGYRLPNVIEDSTSLTNGDVILIRTDGVTDRTARKYVIENASQPASVIAQGLIKHSGREFDDAACVILKWIS
ncbi:hypothetical protein E3V39_03745 [Gammaproteobacteria bacterium LSUCC0112]|nr:hypothetical protein E3V39_03745 [Gammaproteobacteria bacterium LSUCC0112]